MNQRALEAGARASTCMFCGEPTQAGEEVFDQEGNIACRLCGEAEIAAQKSEANERAVLTIHNELEKITAARPEFARQWSRQILHALKAEGFVVVRAEPTEAMLKDGAMQIAMNAQRVMFAERKAWYVYRAMLSAATTGENDASD